MTVMLAEPLDVEAVRKAASTSVGDAAGDGVTGLACAEVVGGNRPVHDAIELPGLRGVLFSRPCGGGHGGDIHYLSVCGSGLLSRLCVADVAGHGDVVAAVSHESYGQLRRSVDTIDERRVLRALDRRLSGRGVKAMTTAVLATYFPPSRRLSISYAGHPEAWLFRRAEGRWQPIDAEPVPARASTFVGLPLGTGLSPAFTRRKLKVEPGDRVLLLTDGVLEAAAADGAEFGRSGLERVLADHSGDCGALLDRLLEGLASHTGTPHFTHDDVTVFVGEFTEGPPGPTLWHVLRNRLRPGRIQVGLVRSRGTTNQVP
jgi:hypothetical protein